MKAKHIFGGISAFALTATAYADVTVNVTGATAFRSATLLAIKAKYDIAGTYKYGHDKAAGNLNGANPNANFATFTGTFPGLTGTTTIRCNFTGSVEGIRALVGVSDPAPPKYIKPSVLSGGSPTDGGKEYAALNVAGTNVETDTSHIAFSDVSKSVTPYASYALQPASPAAGVIVFTMATNDGSAITNVTSQQWRALLSGGFQPRSLFTGDATDNPDGDAPGANAGYVFASGRNDGSGTRTAYLAETGYGVVKTVKQYVVTAAAADQITSIRLVPIGGVGVDTAYASTVWGQDLAGNGGYASGGTLAGHFANKGANVTVLTAAGTNAFGGSTTVQADLVTWVSINDAITIRNGGGSIISYNGVKLAGVAVSGTDLTTADFNKVVEGVYTAWSFENMYLRNDVAPGSDELSVYNTIKAAIPANLAAAGIALTSMHVGRPSDGGTVAP